MTGAVSKDLTVTSWRWEVIDGEQWRTWQVHRFNKLVAMITEPTGDAVEALLLAGNMFNETANYRAAWVDWPT